ncbi:MAG: hypothetical protein HRU20_18075 [Pseudomonadales bacterium]|nr:hypothetical protein [Pseudomonadales bacterium]
MMYCENEQQISEDKMSLQQTLDRYIYYTSIEKDLKKTYKFNSIMPQQCSPRACCDYYVLRHCPDDRSDSVARAVRPRFIDTELLTSLPYVHGTLLNLPFVVTQAYLLSMSAGSTCNALGHIRGRSSHHSHTVIINITQHLLTRCMSSGNNHRLAVRKNMLLSRCQKVELFNDNPEEALLVLLDIYITEEQQIAAQSN